jgi:Fic family protein
MFQPQYELNDRILNAIVAIEVTAARAEKLDFPYALRSKLQQQAKSRNLFHICHLLSLPVTLRDAEKLAEGRKIEEVEDTRWTLVHNFRNLLDVNRAGATEALGNVDRATLLHINKLIISQWQQPTDVRFRTANDGFDGTMEGWLNYRDVDVTPQEMETQLRWALDWFQTEQSRINPIIRAAVLLFRLVQLEPLFAGNQYTLLGMMDLIFYQWGYTKNMFFPLLQLFDLQQKEFWHAWDLSLRTQSLTPWIETFTEAFASGMKEHLHEIGQVAEQQEEKNTSQPFLDLNKRQLKILRYLQNIPTVQRDDYCEMMEVSTMTAYRDLNDLVVKRLLKVDGQGRGTRYKLATR